jgi:LmbE family N-acetylglucosaminyl deacetylase
VPQNANAFLDRPDPGDVYLAPHPDDVCFSVGALASERGKGTLVTVFPVTPYRATRQGGGPEGLRAVTCLRMAEDRAFATACGLEPAILPLPDAAARGVAPFDAGDAEALSRRIERPLMRALMGPTLGRRPEPRPWLFCPAGIGGHVDHLAVLACALRHVPLLQRHYRIAFYEDLHYARDAAVRERGLALLASRCQRALVRLAHPMDGAAQARKMALVHLYGSQLTPDLAAIGAFTPAFGPQPRPHEAIWVFQDDRHQRPG